MFLEQKQSIRKQKVIERGRRAEASRHGKHFRAHRAREKLGQREKWKFHSRQQGTIHVRELLKARLDSSASLSARELFRIEVILFLPRFSPVHPLVVAPRGKLHSRPGISYREWMKNNSSVLASFSNYALVPMNNRTFIKAAELFSSKLRDYLEYFILSRGIKAF